MSDGIFGISITGLRAAQIGLTTTGHNISNASTPGFNRQQIVQSTSVPLFTGAGFLGQGTTVSTVTRIYSQFLDNQVQAAQTQSTYLDTYSAQISQIDNMLADPAAGLSPALQSFFSGVQDVAANPASVPSRQSMISSANALVTRFQTLNGRLQEIRDGVNSQISASVGAINSYARQIANLNQQIVLAQAGSNGQPANDLLDQRDQLIADLNKEINVSVVKQSDGSYNLFMGKGQALVVGTQAFSLMAKTSLDDPGRKDVAYVTNGVASFLSSDSLNGGNLGGLLAFRSETLDAAQNSLGLVAIGLAQTFNDQHRLGQDLNGALGMDFFNISAPTVISNSQNNPASGVPGVTLNNVNNLTGSDYTLTKTAAGYTLTRLSDNTATTYLATDFPITVDGLTITAPGTPATGDSWLIQPTRNGARDIGVAISDTAKIAAAAPISTAATFANTGSGKISAGSVYTQPNPVDPLRPFVTDPLHPATDLNLQQPLTITFTSPTTFSVSSPTSVPPIALAGLPYTDGGNISYNGWTVQITGAPATGDTFTVGPNTNGVSDNRNALLLAGLQTKNTLAGSTASYQSSYSQLVSSVGVKTRDINVTAQAQAALVTQSQSAQQSLSGVNLDEEAANLLRYQQAYQASGKLMQIASTLFNTLLTLGQ